VWYLSKGEGWASLAAGLLMPLEVPEWKSKNIIIDFVVGLPRSPRGKGAIWVVIDRLAKVAHFIPIKTTK
jgi:hypothetical protein